MSKVKFIYYNPGSMPDCVVRLVTSFIKKRFYEYWGISRLDVTDDKVYFRNNGIFYFNNEISGCIGLEDDGEFSNACVKPGHNGFSIISTLLTHLSMTSELSQFYALTPLERLSSAIIFFKLGFFVPHRPQQLMINYSERDVLLAKIVVNRKTLLPKSASGKQLEMELYKLKENCHAQNDFGIHKEEYWQ
jgi:hypothetical protein